MTAQAEVRNLSDVAARHVLAKHGTDTGRRTGWLMISTILIEAWDLYAISFLLLFAVPKSRARPRRKRQLSVFQAGLNPVRRYHYVRIRHCEIKSYPNRNHSCRSRFHSLRRAGFLPRRSAHALVRC
jgi:hypothetical protein